MFQPPPSPAEPLRRDRSSTPSAGPAGGVQATIAERRLRPLASVDDSTDASGKPVDGGLSRAAFEVLVEQWSSRLLHLFWDLSGEGELAQDLVQETWLRAWEHRSTLQEPKLARYWLYRIATNRFREHLRRRAIGVRVLGQPVTLPASIPAAVQPEPMDEALLRALSSLAPADRLMALAIGVHGLSPREAADCLGLSYETGRKRWSRARDRLAAQLSVDALPHPDDAWRRGGGADKENMR